MIAMVLYLALQERKRLKKNILHIQDQMLGMEKMASLGQLSAVIAHEIKNPLNFVINFSEGANDVFDEFEEDLEAYQNSPRPETLERLKETIEELRTNNQHIRHNGQRVDQIINSVMRHTREKHGKRKHIQLNQLVEEQVELGYNAYTPSKPGRNISLMTQYDENIPPLFLHAHELGRVLINLMTNACQAVDLRAEIEGLDYVPSIQVRTQLHNGWVRIYVRDNGIGIPLELQHRIFRPFFTTKSSDQGNAGLGLSLCKDIISQLFKGKISVQSKEKGFTEFEVCFPVPKREIQV